jgi:hypothetical protein
MIATAQEGNYLWNPALLDAGRPAPLVYTHKACCDAFERQHGGYWSAISLECLPYYLATNLQVTWTQAQASGRRMAGR